MSIADLIAVLSLGIGCFYAGYIFDMDMDKDKKQK